MARVEISVADIAAGMYAYSGILATLLQRASTGRGTAVEVSLFDALAEWMSNPAYYTRYSGLNRRGSGPTMPPSLPTGPSRSPAARWS